MKSEERFRRTLIISAAGAVVLSILGVVTFTKVDVRGQEAGQQNARPETELNKQQREQILEQLGKASRDIEQSGKEREDIEHRKLQDAASLVFSVSQELKPFALPGTNTPVKVRGGTITFRTSRDLQFGSVGGRDCVPLKGKARAYFSQDPTDDSSTLQQIDLSLNEQFDLFGYQKDGNSEGDHGVRMVVINNCVVKGVASPGITVEPEDGSSSFYGYRNKNQDNDKTYALRYKDTDRNCKKTGNSDPDSCERLSHVYVHASKPGTPRDGHYLKDWSCPNGDCVLFFREGLP